jgi:hypothetical protein
MDPIISSELTLFAQEIQRFLSPRVLKETAKRNSQKGWFCEAI